MLKINMEYRKGILFVRLKGELNKYTYEGLDRFLAPIIENQGIKYLVVNVNYLNVLDKYGVKALEKKVQDTANNGGLTLICNNKFNINNSFRIIDSELAALNIITI